MIRRPHRLGSAWLARAAVLCAVMAQLPGSARAAADDGGAEPWFIIDELDCPNPDTIRQSLEHQLSSLGLDHQRLALAVRSQGPHGVRVSFVNEGDRFERVLQVSSSAECSILARTLVLLVRGSVERPWRGLAEAFSDVETAAPTPQAVDAPPQPAPPPDDRAPPSPPRSSWQLSLLAGGVSDAAHAGFGTSLEAERALTRATGVGLRLTAAGPLRAPAGGGHLDAYPLEVNLNGRYRVLASEASALDLVAGPALRLLYVRSVKLRVNGTQVLPDAALELGVRGSLAVTRRLALVAALGVSAGVTKRSFRVGGIGSVLNVWPVLGLASAGIRWSLD